MKKIKLHKVGKPREFLTFVEDKEGNAKALLRYEQLYTDNGRKENGWFMAFKLAYTEEQEAPESIILEIKMVEE